MYMCIYASAYVHMCMCVYVHGLLKDHLILFFFFLKSR